MSASIPADKAGSPAPDVKAVPGDDRPLLEARHTGLLTMAVMGVSICQFLDLTIANVALPHMQTSLGASMESISWVMTSFIIAGVMVLPLTGWLSDRLGSRNLFIGATMVFVASSMLCGAATSLAEMVVFRAIQGAASAFIGPLSQTVMFDINRPSRQAHAMSIWGAVVMIAPISGPLLGGWLTETLSWRWVFYVNLPIGIPALILLWWLLPSRPIVPRRLDVPGAVLLAFALGALQLALDRGHGQDWLQSREIVFELLLAACAFWVFAVHARSVGHPLFPGAMMRDANFLMALLFMAILGITNVALSSVLPTMYQSIYGYDVMTTGLLMGPRGVGVLVTMLIVNRLLGRIDTRVFVTAGYLLAALSLYSMTHWSLDMDMGPIIVSGFVQGLGLGLVFVPINLIAFGTLDARYRPDGTTLMTLVRNLGSSVGISFIVTVLARNMQVAHADVAGSVTSFNVPAIDPATAAAQAGEAGAAALTMLNAEVTRQAAMIAYLDNFYMMFWLLLFIAPLVWLLRRPAQPGRAGTADAGH